MCHQAPSLTLTSYVNNEATLMPVLLSPTCIRYLSKNMSLHSGSLLLFFYLSTGGQIFLSFFFLGLLRDYFTYLILYNDCFHRSYSLHAARSKCVWTLW